MGTASPSTCSSTSVAPGAHKRNRTRPSVRRSAPWLYRGWAVISGLLMLGLHAAHQQHERMRAYLGEFPLPRHRRGTRMGRIQHALPWAGRLGQPEVDVPVAAVDQYQRNFHATVLVNVGAAQPQHAALAELPGR